MRLKTIASFQVRTTADCPVVAMLRPQSGHGQWLVQERYELTPWVRATEYVDVYGNLCQRFTAPAGKMAIKVITEIETEEQIAVEPSAQATPVADLPSDILMFLLQSRYCPSEKMADRALEIVGSCQPGYEQAEKIRLWIHQNIRYQYGVSDLSTDALETLKHGAGVCRDFSHIGLALCRSLNLPARLVVGYLYELDPMDLHAWYEVYVGRRWYTFDATQPEPKGGRVVLAYGRDAADVAFLSSYGSMEIEDMAIEVVAVDVPRE